MSESLPGQFMPKFYGSGKSGGEKMFSNAMDMVADGTNAVTGPPAKMLDGLFARNPKNNAPEGFLVIQKEKMIRMFSLRARKMLSSFRRQPQGA